MEAARRRAEVTRHDSRTTNREHGIQPVFAFSVRETEEQKQADGSVRKVAVFRHAGFVPAVA